MHQCTKRTLFFFPLSVYITLSCSFLYPTCITYNTYIYNRFIALDRSFLGFDIRVYRIDIQVPRLRYIGLQSSIYTSRFISLDMQVHMLRYIGLQARYTGSQAWIYMFICLDTQIHRPRYMSMGSLYRFIELDLRFIDLD